MDIISQFQAPATLSSEKQLLIPTEQKVVLTLEERNILPLLGFEPPIPRSSVPYRAVIRPITFYLITLII